MEIRRQSIGERHPEFVRSSSSLALLYWRRGDYAKAQSLLDQGLELTAANQGENHPSYAFYLNNVAELQRQQGNFATAEPLYWGRRWTFNAGC